MDVETPWRNKRGLEESYGVGSWDRSGPVKIIKKAKRKDKRIVKIAYRVFLPPIQDWTNFIS